MLLRERYKFFLDYFEENSPNPQTELVYTNPYDLLVAVILSAQCTDKRVNMTMPALLERFPTAEVLAAASIEEIFLLIKSISFPNNKAKNLKGMATMLVNDFKSEVPSDIDKLQLLPGVGRKTANVIASVIYNQPAMAVDTHVFRVSKRLGLAKSTSKTPLEVELQLTKNIPLPLVHKSHHWLILHGRYICVARTPKCNQCPLTSMCRYYERIVKNIES